MKGWCGRESESERQSPESHTRALPLKLNSLLGRGGCVCGKVGKGRIFFFARGVRARSPPFLIYAGKKIQGAGEDSASGHPKCSFTYTIPLGPNDIRLPRALVNNACFRERQKTLIPVCSKAMLVQDWLGKV